jgi:hypothetical protein
MPCLIHGTHFLFLGEDVARAAALGITDLVDRSAREIVAPLGNV